ncbi:MAG: MGMT family protein, partial [Bacteroides sp.]
QTISYKQLAIKITNPKAYRAVGTVNGHNPFPILIPCHRVVNANGGLGGYTGGLHIKQYLLRLESGKS